MKIQKWYKKSREEGGNFLIGGSQRLYKVPFLPDLTT